MSGPGVGIIGLGEVVQLMHLPVLTRLADGFSVIFDILEAIVAHLRPGRVAP